ncbi:MAG TPA: FtsX-like permease family protein [Candidatus Ligilactobacillus excrementavium]|nr:FtsX-like permease family protein [Candidatus Ligilactobacillus excrementavium]
MIDLRQTFRKNILREFKSSFPRFISIAILLALGAFVLIGLKVTGSDMRATGNQYFSQHKMADAQVTSAVGFNQKDRNYIDQMDHVKKSEYSIYKDALTSDSHKTIRLNEKTSKLSVYKAVQGRLPKKANEIALSKYEKGNYKVGQHVKLVGNDGKKQAAGLKHSSYKIVGFVTSSDYMQKSDLGVSNNGKGQIDTFGVLAKSGFSEQTPNVAKVAYDNLKGKSYSDQFEKQLNENVDQAAPGMAKRADRRQSEIKQDKREQLKDAQADLDEQKENVQEKKTQLTKAKAQLEQNEAKLQQAQGQLADSKAQLAQLPAGAQKNALSQQQQAKQQQVSTQEAQLRSRQQQWQQNSQDLQDAQEKISASDKKLTDQKEKIDQISGLTYQLQARNDYNQGYNQFGEAAERIDVLSNTFPLIFFAVAILVTLTTMSRMAEEKRTDIGVMRALGYTKFDSMKLFLVYGTSAAVLGTAIGAYFGTWLLPERIYDAYAANLAVPSLQTPPSWLWIGISLLFALLCTVVPSVYVVWKSLQEQPADLLVEKPPKAGSKVLLEKVPFIWKRMSFNQKVTIRNLFRYKSRMFMTIIGIFGCTALLITGFGMRDSINGIIDNQYQKITHYDVVGVYDPSASQQQKDDYQKQVDDIDSVKKQDSVYYESATAKPKGSTNNQQVSMIVPQHQKGFSDFITLRDPDSHKKLKLKNDGAVITQKLAKLGNYQVGDHISLKDSAGRTHRVKISAVAEMYAGHDVVLNSNYYQKVFGKKVEYNAKMLNLKDRSSKNIDRVSRQLNKQDAAVTAVQSNQAKTAINTVLDGLNSIVFIIVLASSALSFVVLFTLTNINVSERTRELATLRVLGFYQRETVMYVYRETSILTVLGILVGFGGGYYLHHFIMETLPPNNAMADMALHWSNLGLSTGLTLLFSLIVMVIMARKISKIDMLGALNSAD